MENRHEYKSIIIYEVHRYTVTYHKYLLYSLASWLLFLWIVMRSFNCSVGQTLWELRQRANWNSSSPNRYKNRRKIEQLLCKERIEPETSAFKCQYSVLCVCAYFFVAPSNANTNCLKLTIEFVFLLLLLFVFVCINYDLRFSN